MSTHNICFYGELARKLSFNYHRISPYQFHCHLDPFLLNKLFPFLSTGQPQTFTDFTGTSRYWRLELIDNYGGNCICIHGIRLFGADERIRKLLEENSMDNYADDIIGLVR